ncbi:hypothetical protein MMC34_008745 [Xylographa carneopallida]|nr:hypothetical protein [Xylographa carneopallida]
MKQVLMDRVDSYGNHHTLRCLALASKPMSASNEQVPPLSVFVCTLGWLLDLNMALQKALVGQTKRPFTHAAGMTVGVILSSAQSQAAAPPLQKAMA